MSDHHATIRWEKSGAPWTYDSYTRDHVWVLEGGMAVDASAAKAYRGNPARMNPEDALVASLSSCHMLSFLAIACKRGFVVEAYEDDAVGTLARNGERRLAITTVTLRPRVRFAAPPPSAEQIAEMHHEAHEQCFIANSVKTDVKVEPADAR